MGCVEEQLLWRQGVWAWNQKEAGFSRGWFVPVNIWLLFNVLMSLEYNAWNKRFENNSFFYLYFAFTHQYHHSIKLRGFCCQIGPNRRGKIGFKYYWYKLNLSFKIPVHENKRLQILVKITNTGKLLIQYRHLNRTLML